MKKFLHRILNRLVQNWNAIVPCNHSKPDTANATRELSKANDGANHTEFKTLLHVIKSLWDMKNLGLKLEPTRNAHLKLSVSVIVTTWEIQLVEEVLESLTCMYVSGLLATKNSET